MPRTAASRHHLLPVIDAPDAADFAGWRAKLFAGAVGAQNPPLMESFP